MEDFTVIAYAQSILSQIRRTVIGKDKTLLWVLAAILARGHVLLEDIPGVGKTTMALAFSNALGLTHNRVQFTPDILPSDVTGYSILNPADGKLTYQPGAILCNLFLADELNRATARTQSALLEAMEEGQVTVDGIRHPLEKPFVVIATQNPTGAAGTQLLPDSQMDRFAVRLRLGYPSCKDEISMILNHRKQESGSPADALFTRHQLLAAQQLVEQTYLSPVIAEYMIRLIHATRSSSFLQRGASPRATLGVAALSKAFARLRGRDYVVPRDVQEVFLPALAHRILLCPSAEAQGKSTQQVLQELLHCVPPPKLR